MYENARSGRKPAPFNIYSRDPFRHKSLLSPVSKGIIAGFGLDSYRLALHALISTC